MITRHDLERVLEQRRLELSHLELDGDSPEAAALRLELAGIEALLADLAPDAEVAPQPTDTAPPGQAQAQGPMVDDLELARILRALDDDLPEVTPWHREQAAERAKTPEEREQERLAKAHGRAADHEERRAKLPLDWQEIADDVRKAEIARPAAGGKIWGSYRKG